MNELQTSKWRLQVRLAALRATSPTDPSIISLSPDELKEAIEVEERKRRPAEAGPPEDLKTLLRELKTEIEEQVLQREKQFRQDFLDAIRQSRKVEERIVVVKEGQESKKHLPGLHHKEFPTLLSLVSAKLHVFLVGPAGSGKTTAAEKVAEALDLPFYFNGAIENEYKLLGFRDANGRVVSTPFREAFVNGGVYLFDEVDASLPSAILAFNAALANGSCDFPDGNHKVHENFRCIAAGNTFFGADHQYVGRMKQDAAFLDRFEVLEWPYDTDLEEHIALNSHPDKNLARAWFKMVLKARETAATCGLQVVISPRATSFGLRAMHAGLTWEKAVEVTIRKTMKAADWEKIRPVTDRPTLETTEAEAGFVIDLTSLKPKSEAGAEKSLNEMPLAEIFTTYSHNNIELIYKLREKSNLILKAAGMELSKNGAYALNEIASDFSSKKSSLSNAVARVEGVLRSKKCTKINTLFI